MLKNLIIGVIAGYLFGVVLSLFGALWLLADWGPFVIFPIGAGVLYFALKKKMQLMPFVFLGYGIYIVTFMAENWDKYSEIIGGV